MKPTFPSAVPQGGRPNHKDEAPAPAAPPEGVAAGRNAVLELLRSGRPVEKVFLQRGEREGSAKLIAALALEKGIPLSEAAGEKLDRLAGGVRHQGVVALYSGMEYLPLERLFEIAEERKEPPFFVLLDGVDDPGNLGAVLRCAEAAGAHGVILPKHRCATVTAAVIKASAGAAAHLAICRVPNLAAAIDRLKKEGLWIYGAEAGGSPFEEASLTGPAAFVFGSEGEGISRLVKEKCDFLLSVEMYGKVNSLNVACAAAVVLCEAARQRHRQA